ncbi:F0-ATPase subunit E [Schizosaccharomyces cryophilus OY26]|uniref:F0-ATPase subunit E n=1 Tax=Schizosaccharomyces cryophilus (strain OY26 / ATCC MYA-4695 / CBS 11777 / NBRC 106824 / NRRL Y48691) TaxID=653667 RepID=S9VZ20_SCHCR|nr:F0-ATPase subunit E [Schizosaccharomyces cryophilus OY26]EPY51070.1 F0-ATPase subunit E [Schizosaccharomyces cryophilus OY26]
MNWNIYISLEVRFQLATAKKLFSSASVKHETPNSSVAFFDAALPGSMPSLNPEALRLAIQGALALNCDIAPICQFDRKLVFHPDSLAGYQITQHEMPLGENGFIDLSQDLDEVEDMRIPIQSIQLEQDAIESIQASHPTKRFLDFNRAGSPVIKITVPPCLHEEQTTGALLRKLRMVLCHAGILNNKTELDGMNCSVNISSPSGTSHQKNIISGIKPFKIELENLSSVQSVMTAIEFEVRRQFSPTENSNPLRTQVRGFDDKAGETFFLYEKLVPEGHLYVPETDIPPINLSKAYVEKLNSSMKPLLDVLYATLTSKPYMLPKPEARALLFYPEGYSYYTSVWNNIVSQKNFSSDIINDALRSLASFVVTNLSTIFNEQRERGGFYSISPKQLAELVLSSYSKKGSPITSETLVNWLATKAEKNSVSRMA